MKQYDFAFVYELKNRELDTVCLIAAELEKRGYSCCIINTWDRVIYRREKVSARVVFAHAIYKKESLEFISQYVINYDKCINLQWEQIFTENITKYDFTGMYDTKSKSDTKGDVIHLSWGKYNYSMLTDQFGLPGDKARVCGKVPLDYYRKQFSKFWIPKEEICRRFGLPQDKPIVLFASSFAYVGLPESVLDTDLYKTLGFDVHEFVDVSVRSQNEVIEWLTKVAAVHPELTFIYRPHPAEKDNNLIVKMAEETENIHVISDLSIGHWIVASDRIYLWISTSLCEVYAAGKKCGVLRPVPIPANMDNILFKYSHNLTTYEDFEADLANEASPFPVSEEWINSFVEIDPEKPAYIRVCDVAEECLQKKESTKGVQLGENIKSSLKVNLADIKNIIAYYMVKIKLGQLIVRIRHDKDTTQSIISDRLYTLNMRKNNYVTQSEIRNKIDQISGWL